MTLMKSESMSEKQQRAILEQRALELARKDDVVEKGEVIHLLEFCLNDERYGVECRFVREVYPLKQLTPIPGVPGFVLGIVSVRGEIISVVDLKRFFEIPDVGLTDMTRLVILRHGDMEFAVPSEDVPGTLELPVREIRPPLPTLTGIRSRYLKGVTSDRLVVLDAAKLLGDEKIIVRQD